jgi:hypothetical protein
MNYSLLELGVRVWLVKTVVSGFNFFFLSARVPKGLDWVCWGYRTRSERRMQKMQLSTVA